MKVYRNARTAAGWVIFFALIQVSVFSQESGIAQAQEFRIGAKDLLEITVTGVPEINKLEVRVSEEGNITLPFIGEVKVEGLTKSEVERKLALLLEEDILQDAQVTILIKEYQSKRAPLKRF